MMQSITDHTAVFGLCSFCEFDPTIVLLAPLSPVSDSSASSSLSLTHHLGIRRPVVSHCVFLP